MSGTAEVTAPTPAPGGPALDDRYEILAELVSRDDARTYMARRKADGMEVQVAVFRAPKESEADALSLFAADTQVLRGAEHRCLLPILDAHWVGNDAFAVITQRVVAPTLAELLERGEKFSNYRIADILREVNGLLEWAREQKVVHRAISPDLLFLEPATDRVLTSFAIRPLARSEFPGPADDARTIGALARPMLAKAGNPRAPDHVPLFELRPDLPQRVIEATEALGQPVQDNADTPDVRSYIAAVAMADAVLRGEVEAAHMEGLMVEQQRIEREQWNAELEAHEHRIAELEQRLRDERAEMERTVAEERATMERTLADERAAMQQTLADERATMEGTLTEERATMERTLAEERERLATERDELLRQVAAEREEMQRTITAEQERLATERAQAEAEIARQREESAAALAAAQAELASQRSATEQELADQRTATAQEVAAQRAALEQEIADAREQFDQELASLHAQLDRELAEREERFEAELELRRREQESLAAASTLGVMPDRDDLRETAEARRRRIEAAAEAEAAEVERIGREAREREAAQRAAATAAAAAASKQGGKARGTGHTEREVALPPMQVADGPARAAASEKPAARPAAPVTDDASTVQAEEPEEVGIATPAWMQSLDSVYEPSLQPLEGDAAAVEPNSTRARWALPAAGVALVAIVVTSALGVGASHRQDGSVRRHQVVDSAAGIIAPRATPPAQAQPGTRSAVPMPDSVNMKAPAPGSGDEERSSEAGPRTSARRTEGTRVTPVITPERTRPPDDSATTTALANRASGDSAASTVTGGNATVPAPSPTSATPGNTPAPSTSSNPVPSPATVPPPTSPSPRPDTTRPAPPPG